MSDSAIISDSSADDSGGSLRERKHAARRQAIIDVARDLTEKHGLSRFTVEQLCERVEISRRTFFNYFATKEDAVLGRPDSDIPEDILEVFLAGGSTVPGEISTTLLNDTLDMFNAITARMTVTREDYQRMSAIVAKEPQLQAKLFDNSENGWKKFSELLAQRENCSPTDPRIVAATALLVGTARACTADYFDPHNTLPYGDLARRYVLAGQDLLGHSIFTNQSVFTTPVPSAATAKNRSKGSL